MKRVLKFIAAAVMPAFYLTFVITDHYGVWDEIRGLNEVKLVAARMNVSYAEEKRQYWPSDKEWKPTLAVIIRYTKAQLPPGKTPVMIARYKAVASSKIDITPGRFAEWTAPTTPLVLLYRDPPLSLDDAVVVGDIGDLSIWIDKSKSDFRFLIQNVLLGIFSLTLGILIWTIEHPTKNKIIESPHRGSGAVLGARPMDVAAAVLVKGAWFTLEQCGILLRDAADLYRAKAYPSAVALAMIGREELGKYRMILEEWRKAEDTGKLPTVETIQAACVDHVDKQRRAVLGLTFTAEGPSAFGRAIETQIKHKPQDPEYQEAERVIQAAVKSMAKRAPDARHATRLRALYVDLQDSGADWSRPSQVSRAESKKLINDAANDYAGQRDRMTPDLLRKIGDAKLADALEAWRDRPDLPAPVWSE